MLLTLEIGNTGNYSRSLVEQRVNVSSEGWRVESGIKGWRTDLDIEGKGPYEVLRGADVGIEGREVEQILVSREGEQI